MGVDDIFSIVLRRRGRRTRREPAASRGPRHGHLAFHLARGGGIRLQEDHQLRPSRPVRGLRRFRSRRGRPGSRVFPLPRNRLRDHLPAVDLRSGPVELPAPDCQGEGAVIDHPCDMCDRPRLTRRWILTSQQASRPGVSSACADTARPGSAGHVRGPHSSPSRSRSMRASRDPAMTCCARRMSPSPRQRSAARSRSTGILEGERVQVSVPADQFGDVVTQDGYGMPRSGAGSSKVRGRC